jgi:phosphatidylglycerophosphatase A
MSNRWACILATGVGCGRVPIAPGTVGSLAGVLIFLLLSSLSTFVVNLFFAGCLFVIGIFASEAAEKVFREKDSRMIVIDEIHGMLLTLLLLPGLAYLPFAFILFRGLDILKPFPAGMVERKMSGGLAIMLDDVIAAGYTILILNGVALFIR